MCVPKISTASVSPKPPEYLAAEAEPFRCFDRRQNVRNAREAEAVEVLQQSGIDVSPAREIALAHRAVEQEVERIGAAIRYPDDEIRVRDVMDERNMLVADALDVVLAIAVVEHGRALHRLDCDDLRAELGFEIIARAERSR